MLNKLHCIFACVIQPNSFRDTSAGTFVIVAMLILEIYGRGNYLVQTVYKILKCRDLTSWMGKERI
jgi:hypothetical protein